MRFPAQAKAIRQEQIAHLQLHIFSSRSTHMLLEGGSGPLDSGDFYDPLSKAQREKAREQAEYAKNAHAANPQTRNFRQCGRAQLAFYFARAAATCAPKHQKPTKNRTCTAGFEPVTAKMRIY